jgi:hypothetical protein
LGDLVDRREHGGFGLNRLWRGDWGSWSDWSDWSGLFLRGHDNGWLGSRNSWGRVWNRDDGS